MKTADLNSLIPNDVKMVIWDLDDTFWDGTLSEGGVNLNAANVQAVKTLCERGIVSSICSKNDFEDAKRVLEDAGIWSYFVFPRISFQAKGALIAEIINQANLRADNVLFLDDNHLNLKEALHFAPKLMVAHPIDVLPGLLSTAQSRGKNDVALTRLNQYKQLERKLHDFTANTNSNEDFLRSCGIQVTLDHDIESNLDRVIELINRSNQLNFTKVRIQGKAEEAKLRRKLCDREVYAGIVRVSDKYGDYGIVGFYLKKGEVLEHFVFSCRTMNMGIEQYVYERLGKPVCNIVGPVANGLEPFEQVDWITEVAKDEYGSTSSVSNDKLLLLGSCDIAAVGNYLSTDRAEFVTIERDGVSIRYDDFGFLLSNRETLRNSSNLGKIPCWQADEAIAFDRSLGEARTVIISLWVAFRGKHMITSDGVLIRVHPGGLGNYLEFHRPHWMKGAKIVQLSAEQNVELLRRSLDRIAALSPKATTRAILGANTRHSIAMGDEVDRLHRCMYNDAAKEYAESSGMYEFLSVDETVPIEQLADEWHFSRKGYHLIGTALLGRMNKQVIEPAADRFAAEFDLASFVGQGAQEVNKYDLGSGVGLKRHVKRLAQSNVLGRSVFRAFKSYQRKRKATAP